MKPFKSIADLRAEIGQRWVAPTPRGDLTGWRAVDELYSVVPGQLTVVTGWPSSGKSEWVDALALHLTRQGWKFAVYSPENRPVDLHAVKLVEKHVGLPFYPGPKERMSLSVADEGALELGDSFMLIDPVSDDGEPIDSLAVDDVVACAEECFREAGACKRGLIIDPWNELDHSRIRELTETEYISQALSFVRNWARRTQTHVWIVAHPAKQPRIDGKLPVPRPDMIAGSQHWWNKADCALTVYRDYEDDSGQIEVYSQKCRFKHVGKIGRAYLQWDKATGQYHDINRTPDGRAVVYSLHGGS